MPTFLGFKNSVISALKSPHEGYKPRSRRRVIPFNKALEDLKAAQSGFVICAAFHSFGRCRKEITLIDSNFLATLDQLDVTDVQTPIKLMPLMLCSTHWGKTVYHNALFLDWLSMHGSKQDHPHYENIVTDYQSAVVIDNEEQSLTKVAISSRSIPENQRRPVSAPNSPINDSSHLNGLNTADQLKTYIDHDKPGPTDPEPEYATESLLETSVPVDMESYATIEFGVANLEIMYQENLQCIAMRSNGGRCPAIIHKEQLLKARDLLNSSVISGAELGMELLTRLVLCSEHALGNLPQIYSERWATFADQRLPKEEAVSKFNADLWMSVQFFYNDKRDDLAIRKMMKRPRSASNISARKSEEYEFASNERRGGNSLSPPANKPPSFQGSEFEFSPSHDPPNSEIRTIPRVMDFLEKLSLSDNSADYLSTEPANLVTSTSISLQVPVQTSARAPNIEPLVTGDNLQSGTRTTSDSEPVNTSSITFKIFADISPTNGSPQLEINASSVSEPVIEESIALEQKTGAQDAQPEPTTIRSLSGGVFQHSIQSHSKYIIDNNLIKEMNSPIPRGGYVYIFKSLDRKLVKIGKATDVRVREQQIQAGCQLQDFDLVEVDSIYARYPQRVAKLVRLELQNFQANISCQGYHRHGDSSDAVEQEHREWFDVSELVAVESVQLWRDFVDEAYTSEGTIREKWAKRLTLLLNTTSNETFYLEEALRDGNTTNIWAHHQIRTHRYRTWVTEGGLEQSTIS